MHPAGRTKASVGPKGPSAARLFLRVRPDPPDEFGGSYESECRPEGPYGAEKLDPINVDPDDLVRRVDVAGDHEPLPVQ